MKENKGVHMSGGHIEAGAMAVGDNAVARNTGGPPGGADDPAATDDANRPGAEGSSAAPGPAVHRTILVVDVESFSDRRRTAPHQIAVRNGLYCALRKAFDGAGIPWDDCYHEDRGDGVFLLAPPEVPKHLFVESLPHRLVAALREHNEIHADRSRIRLRMALHAGEVRHDEQGVTGEALIRAFRLVDAGSLKAELAASPGVLAMIMSSWFFDEVVRHSAAARVPGAHREIKVTVKETDTTAWIHLPDHQAPR
jgi:hypothetical protein